jgi:hypothetical protein
VCVCVCVRGRGVRLSGETQTQTQTQTQAQAQTQVQTQTQVQVRTHMHLLDEKYYWYYNPQCANRTRNIVKDVHKAARLGLCTQCSLLVEFCIQRMHPVVFAAHFAKIRHIPNLISVSVSPLKCKLFQSSDLIKIWLPKFLSRVGGWWGKVKTKVHPTYPPTTYPRRSPPV